MKESMNVRSIILVSSLQKSIILGVINKRWDRIKPHILPSQAAYQKGISTNKYLLSNLSLKKALISENYMFLLQQIQSLQYS